MNSYKFLIFFQGLGFLVVYSKESMARVKALNVKYWARTVHDDDAAGFLRQSVGVMLDIQ